jgi:hypothetical protein
MNQNKILRQHVTNLLKLKGAHASAEDILDNWPSEKRGLKPQNLPYSGWQLLEHLRIAQWDILEFSRDPNHVSPNYPEDYWPKDAEPPSDNAWDESLQRFQDDNEQMQKLVNDPDTDLFAKIPHGDGQTILREALLVADHNAYHLGELVVLRRLLNIWISS